MRRASTACTECQRRRTRVLIHRVPRKKSFLLHPFPPIPYHIPNLTLFSLLFSVPALLIVPNAQLMAVIVSSTKPPIDAGRPPQKELRIN
jgi:hypothetical protein